MLLWSIKATFFGTPDNWLPPCNYTREETESVKEYCSEGLLSACTYGTNMHLFLAQRQGHLRPLNFAPLSCALKTKTKPIAIKVTQRLFTTTQTWVKLSVLSRSNHSRQQATLQHTLCFSRSGLSQGMSLGVQFKYCLKVTKTKEGFLSKLQTGFQSWRNS